MGEELGGVLAMVWGSSGVGLGCQALVWVDSGIFEWLNWPDIIRLAEVPPKGGILTAISSLRLSHGGASWQ